jgi:hypothetical protein
MRKIVCPPKMSDYLVREFYHDFVFSYIQLPSNEHRKKPLLH